MSGGTCGTIAGVSRFLKSQDPSVQVVLADCQGSSLANLVNHGTTFTKEQAEKSIKRHRYDTLVEGIGLDRITANMKLALETRTLPPSINYALKISDQEVVLMARKILREEGLLLCSSGALNLCCCVKIAEKLQEAGRETEAGSEHKVKIVTVLSGSGIREVSKLYSKGFLEKHLGMQG